MAFLCTRSRDRTGTAVKPQDFKSCVSTSSTTRAYIFTKKRSEKGIGKRAKDGIRTRDPDLGKVVLYQLSYFRLCLFLKRCKYIFSSLKTIPISLLSENFILRPSILTLCSYNLANSCCSKKK